MSLLRDHANKKIDEHEEAARIANGTLRYWLKIKEYWRTGQLPDDSYPLAEFKTGYDVSRLDALIAEEKARIAHHVRKAAEWKLELLDLLTD